MQVLFIWAPNYFSVHFPIRKAFFRYVHKFTAKYRNWNCCETVASSFTLRPISAFFFPSFKINFEKRSKVKVIYKYYKCISISSERLWLLLNAKLWKNTSQGPPNTAALQGYPRVMFWQLWSLVLSHGLVPNGLPWSPGWHVCSTCLQLCLSLCKAGIKSKSMQARMMRKRGNIIPGSPKRFPLLYLDDRVQVAWLCHLLCVCLHTIFTVRRKNGAT